MRLGKVRHESKYLAIEYFHTEKNWSIGWMCKHLEVARAAYYKWLHRETPEDEMENIKLAELIKEYDERFSHILGYRRMTSWINHFNQTKYSKNRVHRIMKKLGIHSVIRKKKKKYRNANADETTQNILQRDFYATAPNQKWATDVTEFNIRGDKLYLSPVMDLFNGEIIAFQMERRPVFGLVKDMLKEAIETLNLNEKPMIHSDQGWQYQMRFYQKQLAERGLTQSMSRKGNCLDNAAMESFFGILKSECFYGEEFKSVDELEQKVKEYIHYYNHERIKVKLKGLTPVEYRNQSLEIA